MTLLSDTHTSTSSLSHTHTYPHKHRAPLSSRSLICSLAQCLVSLCAWRSARKGPVQRPSPCRHKAANRNKPDQSLVRGRSVTHTHVSTSLPAVRSGIHARAHAHTHTTENPNRMLLDTQANTHTERHMEKEMPTNTDAHYNCPLVALCMKTHIHTHVRKTY